MKNPLLPLLALVAFSPALSAATWLSGGTIQQGGVTVANYSFTTTGTTGYGASTTTVGASGIEFDFASDTGNPDMMAVQMMINPLTGWGLDTYTVSQTPYFDASGNNGPGGANDNTGTAALPYGPEYSILGYTGAFTYAGGTSVDGDDEITAPVVSGADLTWSQIDKKIPNSQDNWGVTLTDFPGFSTPLTLSFKSDSSVSLDPETIREWIAFDATFIEVPEPSRAMLLGLGLMGL